jgi:hypothetical protein
MPEQVPTEATPSEDFTSWRGKPSGERGSAAPADVSVKVPDVTDTGSSAAEGKPDAKTADASETSQQGKVDKRKSEIQREIDELTRKKYELQREVEAKAKPSETAAPKEPATAAAAYDGSDAKDPAPKEPDQKDAKYAGANGYELWQKDEQRWLIDTAKWELRRDSRVETHKATQEQAQRSNQEKLETFRDRGNEYAADHDDYPELVEQFEKRTISHEMGYVIVTSENGPSMLHELMLHPDELKRIDSLKTPGERLDALYELKYKCMSPEQLRKVFPQLGEGENTETRTPANVKPKASAPAPGTRVNGSGGGSSREPSSYMAHQKSMVQQGRIR